MKCHSAGLATFFEIMHKPPKSRTNPILTIADRRIPSLPHKNSVNGLISNTGFMIKMSMMLSKSKRRNQCINNSLLCSNSPLSLFFREN